ncbi:MAG: hypothetical protein DMD43_06490 [Gemmatimonadetes bacterium]|nr:MAG: hypothetical protein DMD43_06490 [Gemmatimonadota bacterium]
MLNPLSTLRAVPAALRRATALAVVALQLSLVVAPLAEIGRWDSVERRVTADRGDPGRVAAPRLGGPAVSHNELTCPACIARSLHSRPALQSPLLISEAEQPARPLLTAATVPFARPSAFHFSRAPPIAV